MNILFWNINKKNLKESIYNISVTHNIDVIILAESTFKSSELVLELNKETSNFFPQNSLSQCEKIQIITKFHYDFATPICESSRYTIRKINLPEKIEILLTAIHFVDKSNHSIESQGEMAGEIIKEIDKIETELNIHSNIIVGDFNMNPFESGIIKCNGFHATMSSEVAKTKSRTVQGKEYKYFYNPMWSLYGDLIDNPVGTYYYKNAELVNYQWNIFDQVLVRPNLVDRFKKNSLKILTNDGGNTLVNQKNIPKGGDSSSDHLPIIFTINLNK